VPLDKAAFVISIDTEMAWGLAHRPGETYRYDRERAHLARLVELFDRYEVPATWATVGHLLLEGCAPVDGVKHPEIVRPTYTWLDGDWFDVDPCEGAESAPTWYAPDMIDLFLGASVDHEIATHGFSHIVAGPGCSRATFASELDAALAAAAARGIGLRSMVHPRNQIDHLDTLAERGIVAYRGLALRPQGSTGRLAGMIERVIDRAVGSERTTVRPVRERYGWNLPATVLYDIDAHLRIWPVWIAQVNRRLSQAVRRQGLFHLWFHPHNFRDNPEPAFAGLERILRVATGHRDEGRLMTVTMGDLAAHLDERPRAHVVDQVTAADAADR
jgi:peptidoglycan/xylan/chitin deacetylase (PgdA/CDA1 family)